MGIISTLFPRPTKITDYQPIKGICQLKDWIIAAEPKKTRKQKLNDFCMKPLRTLGKAYYNLYFTVTGFDRPFTWKHADAIKNTKRALTITGRVGKVIGYTTAAAIGAWAVGSAVGALGTDSTFKGAGLVNGIAFTGKSVGGLGKSVFHSVAVPTYIGGSLATNILSTVGGFFAGVDMSSEQTAVPPVNQGTWGRTADEIDGAIGAIFGSMTSIFARAA